MNTYSPCVCVALSSSLSCTGMILSSFYYLHSFHCVLSLLPFLLFLSLFTSFCLKYLRLVLSLSVALPYLSFFRPKTMSDALAFIFSSLLLVFSISPSILRLLSTYMQRKLRTRTYRYIQCLSGQFINEQENTV